MDWVVPFGGWESGGVIDTTSTVRRQKTPKGLGGIFVNQRRPREFLDRAVQNFRNIVR